MRSTTFIPLKGTNTVEPECPAGPNESPSFVSTNLT